MRTPPGSWLHAPAARPVSPTVCCAGFRTGRRSTGGPVGLTTLAVSVGEEPETVETVAEPYLVREGLVVRTPRGRAATPAAYSHLGLEPPADGALFS